MAMPTGTRKSISTNKTTKPVTATASALMRPPSLDRLHGVRPVDPVGMEDQAIGTNRNEQNGRDVTEPGHGEERPRRQVQVVGEDVVVIGLHDLVEQHDGLHT